LREPEPSYEHVRNYCAEIREILSRLEYDRLDDLVQEVIAVKERQGRLFVLGSGGSAANASHAVNDFRKLGGIEAYSPSDNVAELTARINDNGWTHSYVDWLIISRMAPIDLMMILSVGGGSTKPAVSMNLVAAMKYAKAIKTPIISIVGRDGGQAAKLSKVCIIIPTANEQRITPHVESFQELFWHMIVTDPRVQHAIPHWESL